MRAWMYGFWWMDAWLPSFGFMPNPFPFKTNDVDRAEEPHTCSLLFCVLDGHGVFGELVSSFFQRVRAERRRGDNDMHAFMPSR